MKKKGFTLIELIVVIIVLGILAAYAVPRLINFGSAARISVLRSLEANLRSADKMVYSIAATNGVNRGEQRIDIGIGREVHTFFGHPQATEDGILAVLDIEFENIGNNTFASPGSELRAEIQPIIERGGSIFFFPASATDPTECFVEYFVGVNDPTPENPEGTTQLIIEPTVTGC